MHQKTLIGAAVWVSVIGLGIAACNNGDDEVVQVNSGVVIQNVTVVNTRDGSLAGGAAVVIDGGKIQRIVGNNAIRVGSSVQTVDGTGKYVVPGFLDMHTHTLDAADATPTKWPLLIANGITGVREMTGSAASVQRARQLNADSAAGKVDAPEILLIPGEIFGGELVGQPPIAGSSSAVAAVAEVQKQKAYGAGFVKNVRSTRDATLAMLTEAKNQGIDVAGHLSPSVGGKESSDNGWKAIEHLGGGLTILLDCSSNEDSIRTSVVAGAAIAQFRQSILDTYDDAKCQSLARTFAANKTWHVPTLIKLRTGLVTNDPAYVGDPNLVYVSKTLRASWAAAAQNFGLANDATSAARLQRYFSLQQTMPKLFKQNGVKMLAGSDTATGPAFVIPGFSLHQEFKLLAGAGLTPLDILLMTTLNGAEFLGRQATMGTVEEGKNADLVLLDANPVADVANLDAISGVFLKGRYFSKVALDKLKSDVAAAYAVQPAGIGSGVDKAHVD